MKWEVFIPASEPGSLNKTVTVDGANWLAALTAGVEQLGLRGPNPANVMLDIKDHAVHVTDVQNFRVFEVRPLDGITRKTLGSEQEPSVLAGDADDDAEAADTQRMAAPPSVEAEPPAKTGRSTSGGTGGKPNDAVKVPSPKKATGKHAAAAKVPGPVELKKKASATSTDEPLKKKTTPSEPPKKAVKTPTQRPAKAKRATPKLPKPKKPENLINHEVFFTHEEDPGAESRLSYRERLLAVSPDTTPEKAEELLRYYFELIQHEISGSAPGKFINLAVFNHQFHERAERPAVAALNWKDWRGSEAEVTFPLSSPAVVETSYIPAAEEQQKEKKSKKKSGKHKRIPSQELHIGRTEEPKAKVDLNEVLAEVFEAMQDLYSIRNMEECIAFGVNLAAQKIPCQAAAGLATVSGKDEMVCICTSGTGIDGCEGKRIPLKGTLIGFAAIQGVAVAVSDAENDDRVSTELDRLVGAGTRSLLCAPLVFEGRTFGVVELVNRRGGDKWRQGEINIVSYIANHLSEYVATSLPTEPDDFEAEEAPPAAAPRPLAKKAQPQKAKSPAAAKKSSPSKKKGKKRRK